MNIQQENDSPEEGSEAAFEQQLIKHLQNIGGTKQWQYRPDIKTTQDLWNNFRHILERTNSGKLGGKPLTNEEFDQVKRELLQDCSSPYKAGQWLYGFNGVTQIEVHQDSNAKPRTSGESHQQYTRENKPGSENTARDQSIFLTVFDQDQVGAGNTTYQIVNQIERPPVRAGMPSRRFDTTLLINGLPIIQIEEKSATHDVNEALRQEERYLHEGQYGGIFSTLQILVGMTPYDCKYMAMTDEDHFSLDFAFRWQTEKGDPVFDWRTFTDLMLSIPMAHQMATSYMILDGEQGHDRLIVMRPYQVYATRRVISAVKAHDFSQAPATGIGYIWHTTGSGKTITSFKTAWLASRLPSIDKVIFLVDRIALTRQTFDKYRAYDPDATADTSGVVSDTRNVFDLASKIRSKQSRNSIVVTSIQKMGDLCKHNKFPEVRKRCVFICDEAHRSTNGEMLQNIQKKFPFSAWVGYTGTPIFDNGATEKIFGKCLHSYTIKQGIADHNVLGFKVDFEHTLDSDEVKEKLLPSIIKGQHPLWDDHQVKMYIARIEPEEVDGLIDSGVYDMNEKHVHAVVKNILDHWENRSVEGRYSALLTTHVKSGPSTPMAMMYFQEFVKQNEKLKQEGRTPLTIAVTFAFANNNQKGQKGNNKDLDDAIDYYNKEFGTHFTEESVDEYFADVTSRLGGMDPGTGSNKPRKLDLVIVVNQLLTGFDAPKLNTLYVDRTLSGASLIQAYSRTNRIDDNQYKPFGRIVNFRWPQTSKELMNDALRVYANKNSAEDPIGVIVNTHQILKKVKSAITTIRHITKNFTVMDPPAEEDKRECLKQLGTYNRGITALKQDETLYDPQHPEKFRARLGLSNHDAQALGALPHTITPLQRSSDPISEPSLTKFDLDFHVEHVGEARVNYSYLEKLLAAYLNARTISGEGADAQFANFTQAAAQLDDLQQARRFTNLADTARRSPNGRIPGVSYPVKPEDVAQLAITNARNNARQQILAFREKWGLLDIDDSKELIDRLISRHTPGQDDLNGEDMNTLLKNVTRQKFYRKDATEDNIRQMNIFKYRNALPEALRHLADQVVQEAPDM